MDYLDSEFDFIWISLIKKKTQQIKALLRHSIFIFKKMRIKFVYILKAAQLKEFFLAKPQNNFHCLPVSNSFCQIFSDFLRQGSNDSQASKWVTLCGGKDGKALAAPERTKIGINKNVIQFIFNFAERHGKCVGERNEME